MATTSAGLAFSLGKADGLAAVTRAENLIHGRPDLKDTIRRLEAFAAAGADVLFAPGLTTLEEITTVVRAVAPKPVNVVARAAYGAFFRAAQEIHEKGSFDFARDLVPYAVFNNIFSMEK